MADFKLTIANPKSGKCVQRELKAPDSNSIIGKKIGEKIDGKSVGLDGFEFELTGGSDYCGFPMRKDVQGSSRKRILAVKGVGLKKKAKGIKQRKTVCGNTIHEKITQVNLKVLKEGKEKLFEEKKEDSKEVKKEEKPAEKKKEEAKPEVKKVKKEEVKEQPKEEKKPEEKKEEPKQEKKEEKPAE